MRDFCIDKYSSKSCCSCSRCCGLWERSYTAHRHSHSHHWHSHWWHHLRLHSHHSSTHHWHSHTTHHWLLHLHHRLLHSHLLLWHDHLWGSSHHWFSGNWFCTSLILGFNCDFTNDIWICQNFILLSSAITNIELIDTDSALSQSNWSSFNYFPNFDINRLYISTSSKFERIVGKSTLCTSSVWSGEFLSSIVHWHKWSQFLCEIIKITNFFVWGETFNDDS